MIILKRDKQYITVLVNRVEAGHSFSIRGGRVLINPSIKDEYIDVDGFTKDKIKKNPEQELLNYFPNLDLNQGIKLINF